MAVFPDLASVPLITIAPENSIMDAARLMSELDVDALPVCDGHTVVGLVTDRDITLRGAGRGCAPRSTAVAEVMQWRIDDEPAAAPPRDAIDDQEAIAAQTGTLDAPSSGR